MASAIPFFFGRNAIQEISAREDDVQPGLCPVRNPDILHLVSVPQLPAAFGFRSLQQVNVAACVSLACQVSRPVRRRLLSLFH
jgi:hypothetical protein